MAKVFTTEITSDEIVSDNPIHQRLFKAYVVAKDDIRGDVLEVGCGEGRGISTLLEHAKSFTAVDKIGEVIDGLIMVLEDPEVTVKDLMKKIKGPDFPTGGIIHGKKGIVDAYTTGRGTVRMRAKAEIEEHGKGNRIIITEVQA